jgi:hypothetical protein
LLRDTLQTLNTFQAYWQKCSAFFVFAFPFLLFRHFYSASALFLFVVWQQFLNIRVRKRVANPPTTPMRGMTAIQGFLGIQMNTRL